MNTTTSEFKEPTLEQMIEYVDEKYDLHAKEPLMSANDDVTADQATSWNEHNRELRDMYAGIRGQLLAVKMYNHTHPHGISMLGRVLGAFKRAKDLIQQWHNFSGNNSQVPKEELSRMWEIYDRKSPEMTEINGMIEWLGKEVVDGK